MSNSNNNKDLKSTMNDWNRDEEPAFDNKHSLSIDGVGTDMLTIQLTPSEGPLSGLVGMEAAIEINRGVPCLHITNNIGGDNVMHLYFTKDGIIQQNEQDDAPRSEFDSKKSSLGELQGSGIILHENKIGL